MAKNIYVGNLVWDATSSSRCAARGAWHGPRTTRGTEVVGGIVAGSRFELACENDGGASVAQTTVQVTPASAPKPAWATARQR